MVLNHFGESVNKHVWLLNIVRVCNILTEWAYIISNNICISYIFDQYFWIFLLGFCFTFKLFFLEFFENLLILVRIILVLELKACGCTAK